MEIEPGYYDAKIVDCGLRKSKAGNEMVFVTFELDINGKRLDWFGNLSTTIGKTGKSGCMMTVDQLLRLGFKNDWDAFGSGGNLTDCFEAPEKTWSLKIEMNDFNGKQYPKIRYINDPEGSGGTANKLTDVDVKNIVSSKNLKALTIQAKQSMTKSAPKAQFKAVNSDTTVDDIFA